MLIWPNPAGLMACAPTSPVQGEYHQRVHARLPTRYARALLKSGRAGRSLRSPTRRATGLFMVAACALALASCATVTRIPYTQQEQSAAVIPGIPGARIWADDPAIATVRRSVVSRVPAKQPVVLALSGGGADGAFGAGLLAGWSARGNAAAIHISDRSQRRRADCAVRIPRSGLRRNPQECVCHRRDGQLAAIGGIGGTVRHGSFQDGNPCET